MDWLKWSCWRALRPFAAYGWNEMESNKAKVGERANKNKINFIFNWAQWARQQQPQNKQPQQSTNKLKFF